MSDFNIPDLGKFTPDCGLIALETGGNGRFRTNHNSVISITATGDRKVEFIAFTDHTLAAVNSAMGYPAFYPVHPVALQKPVKAVLMDLDGTTVRSEEFWMWIIEQTTASLLDKPKFSLEETDMPHVSGHSVSEHLQYCVEKYCSDKTVEEARQIYYQHVHREMQAIVAGNGRANAFTPTPGVREFLLTLKAQGINIGLVTSGLYEKAYPEILSAFKTMGMGDPQEFYDVIITAGFPLRAGEAGTLGELTPKPHPWLYAEACRVGLGIPFAERNTVVGIDDSGAGVCSIRLAGFPTIGLGGGNIVESGTKVLCDFYSDIFAEIEEYIE
ncbi:MAG: HAD family phosphatase [Chloroflexi bacterium]|nr:MAG: HAD family phosphatase [Chloroflexota bacterium]